MKRKKETVIFIVFIVLLGLWRFSGAQQVYLSPEKVLYACEKGLHYGPSEKILLKKKGKEGKMLVIGKTDSRTLSVVPVKRTLLGMWSLYGGGVPGQTGMAYDTDRILAHYSSGCSVIYGLTDLEEADTITCVLEYKNNSMADFAKTDVIEMRVDEDGFFTAAFEPVDDESWYYAVELKAYDKNGDLIFDQVR